MIVEVTLELNKTKFHNIYYEVEEVTAKGTSVTIRQKDELPVPLYGLSKEAVITIKRGDTE